MIEVSANKLIGALVYRTMVALNANEKFKENLKGYEFAGTCFIGDTFNLWNYPGTPNEISNTLLSVDQLKNGTYKKFPSILNFQTIKQTRSKMSRIINYNLAIVGRVDNANNWTTQDREDQLFDKLLRPIYNEFINQILKCGWVDVERPIPTHTYYEVFTTGDNAGQLLKRYGNHIDAIELHNLSLSVKNSLCQNVINEIEQDDIKGRLTMTK